VGSWGLRVVVTGWADGLGGRNSDIREMLATYPREVLGAPLRTAGTEATETAVAPRRSTGPAQDGLSTPALSCSLHQHGHVLNQPVGDRRRPSTDVNAESAKRRARGRTIWADARLPGRARRPAMRG
jgi:hypothetical protein